MRRLRLLILLAALAPANAVAAEPDFPARLVTAASAQIGVTLGYDGAYVKLAYPGGDVPIETGVCTDVVVRAYRALGVDLQQRVHEDMRRAFATYPKLWGLKSPDSNIDHRRVPNLATYFARHGTALEASQTDASLYAPGDIVTWRLPSGVPHIGIVSTRRVANRPTVVHNIGLGTRDDDALFAFVVTGHYRYAPAVTASSPR